jgi:hypothetical protein
LVRKYMAVGLGAAAVASVAISVSSPGSSAEPSRTASRRITFSVPTPVDPIHTFGEPTINFNIPRGQLFASGPTGTGTQRSVWEASADGGHTFRIVTPGPVPTAFQSTNAPPGGGDTDLNFDRAGKEYFLDLYALECLRAATTSNGGAGVQQSFNGCGGHAGADRQWLAVYDPAPGTPHKSAYHGKAPLIYEEFNNLVGNGGNGDAQWNKSTDGLHFSNATSGVTQANEVNYSPFGSDGYPAIDQETGKVFQAAGRSTSKTTFALDLNIGTPDSQGNLTFLDHPTSSGGGQNTAGLIPIATNLPAAPDTLFSVLSMDTARNLFVVYTTNDPMKPGQDQTYVSAASAASGWKKWTKPVQVSDGSTASGDAVNVFPWIKAGGPGRADAVWYGSNKAIDPSTQAHQAWNVFMSQLVFPVNSSGAITGAPPTKTLVRVSPHPAHYNDICLQGSACISSQGNRNLADFFSVTIDSSGAAEIIYDDTSNGLVQPGFTPGNLQLVDHAGAPLVTIARQASGMGLYGHPVTGPSNRPVVGLADRSGDALYPVIAGKNVPGLDILHSSLYYIHSGGPKLEVTMNVANLKTPSATASKVPNTQLDEYVTRWQMGNTLFYAGMSSTASGSHSFYAGKTGSVDLCSVSACFPHVLTYPESGSGGTSEHGTVSCPKAPSARHPCTIRIYVAAGDVGSPKPGRLLQEVGAYAFATSHPQGTTNNVQALADSVPLEIDGVCCYDFNGSGPAPPPVKQHHRPHHHPTHHHKRRHHHRRPSRRPKRRHARGFTG